MFDQFNDCDKDRIEISGDGAIARALTGYCGVYCKFTIPNDTKEIFKWYFKCHSMISPQYWGIGIDAVRNNPEYSWYFYNDSSKVNYFYKANGDIWKHGIRRADIKTAGWGKGDMIVLIYNGNHRKLSISINGEHDGNSVLTVEEQEGGFRVAAYMGHSRDQIELLQ